ncbi:MAG: ATP-dependent DNA ligase [Crenarchaeota archaeon]|nr:ATP-dependent DNA ligase [Thermoproteota archaeon]
MFFKEVAEVMEQVESTTKRLEMTNLLVELFKKASPTELEKLVYLLQGKVRPDYEGLEFGIAEKLVLRSLSEFSGVDDDTVEKIYKETGDLGSVAEILAQRKIQKKLLSREPALIDVYEKLYKLAKLGGKGSVTQKTSLLSSLLIDMSPKEAKYAVRIVTGRLRLGIADYTILDAIAQAFTGDRSNRPVIERAYNISSDLGAVARTVAEKGINGVYDFKITVGKPIRPMLAERLTTVQEVLEKISGDVAAEYKLDGERVQIHKNNGNVLLFSRRLENITSHYPDAIEMVNTNVKAKDAILEAECVAINADTGELLPFQELMHRRRKYGIEEAMKEYPIALFFFDLLYADGIDYTEKTYLERREALKNIILENERVKLVRQIISRDPDQIESFMEEAISEGCEGLVIKDLKASYRAGAREWSWIKLKREYKAEVADTLDLVIVGGFHGRGKRAGKYGAYLLAVYDPDEDVFRTFAKCGTGFTDDDLTAFTEIMNKYKIDHKHARVDSKIEADVWFEPKIVIEIIASEITLSPVHTCGLDVIRRGSGLAGRFPKYTGRLRDDKAPEQATTVKEIIEIYKNQLKKVEEQPQEST